MFTHVNVLTKEIIGAAIEVHRELGPGFGEEIYQRAMEVELAVLKDPQRRRFRPRRRQAVYDPFQFF